MVFKHTERNSTSCVCVWFMCVMCVCVCLSLCAPVVCSAPWGQKRASDPLELETQSDAWYGCWEPNTSSERRASCFNYWAIFPVLSVSSLIQPMSICLGMVLLTVDWTLPCLSWIKTISHRLAPIWSWQFFNLGSLFPSFIKLAMKN